MYKKICLILATLVSATSNLSSSPSGIGFANGSPAISLVENYRRVVTPNRDGFNDEAYFLIENLADLPLKGAIYDFSGSSVSEMRQDFTANKQALVWDGKDSSGNAVPQGVYIYKIIAGEQALTGTLLVAK